MTAEHEELVKRLREAYELSGGINSSSGVTRLIDEASQAIVSLSKSAAAEKREWLPIESAPKDGTAVLLFLAECPRDRNYTVTGICDDTAIGFWMHGTWKSFEVEDCGSMGGEMTGWMPDYTPIDLKPTHWMPLPEPPALSPTRDGGKTSG